MKIRELAHDHGAPHELSAERQAAIYSNLLRISALRPQTMTEVA